MSATRAYSTERGAVVYGLAAGIGSYLIGFLLAYVATASTVERVTRGFVRLADVGAAFAPPWKIVGWVFYDAHLVGTRVPGVSGDVNLVALAEAQYLYVLPPLLLVVAGAIVATLARVDGPRAGVRAGLTVASGYLLCAVVGAVLVSFARIQPDLLRAAVVAGVVYPVAFGAIGGGLAGKLRADRRPRDTTASLGRDQ